jgi:predicted nucleic acid-binding protein
MKVVSDTSPLLALAKLGWLGLLSEIFDKVVIPRAVLEEVRTKRDAAITQLNTLVEEGLVEVVDADDNLSARLHGVVDRGEAEALAVALETNAPVMLDDKCARKLARELAVETFGTLSVLRTLLNTGHLSLSKAELFAKLMSVNFRISRAVFDEAFKETERAWH